jgi:hypothetical protein
MKSMHWLRTTGRLPRALFAALFGVMSMVHFPVMTAAKAAPAVTIAQTDQAQHQHHEHGTAQTSQDVSPEPSVPGCDMNCQGLGCFQSVTPALSDAPLVRALALATLCPAPSRAMQPALADPADPPPRLQV